MAKLSTPFTWMGNFAGAVVSKTRDGYIVRQHNPKPHNPSTPAQVRQRAIFKSANNVASLNSNISLQGLRNTEIAQKHTLRNSFVSENIRSGAFSAPEADTQDVTTTFNPANFVLSKGNVVGVNFSSLPAEQTDSLTISVGYSGNMDMTDVSRNDKVYLAAMLTEGNDKNVAGRILLSEGSDRSSSTATLNVPSSWVGGQVYVWGFVAHQGSSTDGVKYSSMMDSREAQITTTEVLSATNGMTYSETTYLGQTSIV